MLIKKPDDIKTSEITDKQTYLSRRKFIAAGGVAAAGLAAGGIWLYANGADNLDDPRPSFAKPKPYNGMDLAKYY